MKGRAVGGSLMGIGIAVVIAWALLGTFRTLWTSDPSYAFGVEAGQMLFFGCGVGIVAWVACVVTSGLRLAARGGRSAARAYAGDLGWLLVALTVNLVVLLIVFLPRGEWIAFGYVYNAFVAGVALVLGALVGLALRWFVIFRNRAPQGLGETVS